MLSLQRWNSFTNETRIQLADAVYECSTLDTAMYHDLAYPWHHKLAGNHPMRELMKNTLHHLKMEKNGTVRVTVFITPRYEQKKDAPKPQTKKPVSYPELAMKHFRVRYVDETGDLTNVRVLAENATQAKESAKNEYWDIKDIIEVTEID